MNNNPLENLEARLESNQQEKKDIQKKLKEEKYSLEFSNSIKNEVDEKLNTLDSSLINENEKKDIISKLDAVYVNNKSKGLDFNLKKELIKVIKSMSFESAGDFSEKNYLIKNNEIRKKIISELKGKQKDHFQNFHEHQKEKVYDPNDTIPSTEIPQFKDTGVENFGENNKKYETILNNLVEQGQLSKETTELLKKENLDTLDIEKTKIPEEEKKVLKEVFSNIKNPEQNKKSNLENLKKDLKEIQSIVGKENFDFNLEQNNQNFSQEVLNKIGGNYLNIQNKDGKIDYEKNFSLAIDTTKIQIENGVKNINKNSETYKQAIKNIASDNLATKLEGIQSLYALAYSGEGKFAKKSQEKYKKHRGEKLQKQYDKLNQELQELQKQQTEQAKKKTEQIKQEIESIQKEAKEISSGDIFKATKQETNDTGKEKEPTK